jgi:hypothetical protein
VSEQAAAAAIVVLFGMSKTEVRQMVHRRGALILGVCLVLAVFNPVLYVQT